MNREIKFRAWDWDAKQMLYHGIFLGSSGSVYTLGAMENDCGFDDCINETEHYPAMQYTGLKDKNGKEIYEGDILDWNGIEKAVVEWSEGDADYLLENINVSLGGFDTTPVLNGLSSSKTRFYQVIGNIYENPELLK